MRIKFINALLGGDFSALDIAITVLATVVNEKSVHKATITDLTFHRRDWKSYLNTEIDNDRPDLIAISTNTMYMQYVEEIASQIKKVYGLPVLLGGHHASRFPKDTANLPYCDWVLAGDAEETLPMFLDRLAASNNSLKDIPGICYRQGSGLFLNQNASFTADLDSIPIPNWDLWKDIDKYFYFLQMLYIIGSRGCPYKCTYCDAVGIDKAVHGSYYRKRDPRAFAREIAYQWEKYRNRGLALAQLFDPVFTLEKKWVLVFCDEYRSLGLHKKLGFSSFSRIDNLDDEMIEALGKSGCSILRVGLESGDEYIRNTVYKKKISDSEIRNIFKRCKSAGIHFTAFYILGGPGESPASMQKTISLARDLDAERSAFFIYKPFTEEGKNQIIEHGGWIDEEKWAKADNITFGAVVESPNYSTRLVEWYQKKAYFLTFGLRLLRMIKRHPLLYFARFCLYFAKGFYYGLDYKYVAVYYHIYSYDNVDK